MKNVLLVDDDRICNLLTTRTLERLGLANDIHTALNGKEALNLFNDYYQRVKNLPDIILLDLNMPIMDGFGFLEAFQRLDLPAKQRVRIIIVSSSMNPADRQRAQGLGINRYIAKPIDEKRLLEALESE